MPKSAVKLVLFAFGLLGWGAAAAHALEIHVQGDPPLPVANLVQNSGAEQGANGAPAVWHFTTAIPENFTTAWRDDGRSGKCLYLKAKTGSMSGYWNQSVRVEPDHEYLLTGYYRLGGGRLLCYVHGRRQLPDNRSVGVDQRFYAGSLRGHWLSPVFLPPDALAGPDPTEWIPFQLKVPVPDKLSAVEISLGMYFTPGEVSFDDLWFGLAQTTLAVDVKADAGETIRQVVVHRSGTDKPIYDSHPLPPGKDAVQFKLTAQPTTDTYRIVVTLGDGKTVTQEYPAAEKGGAH